MTNVGGECGKSRPKVEGEAAVLERRGGRGRGSQLAGRGGEGRGGDGRITR